ncbi:hypothetical protein C1701_23965 [Actinoalloteichus sp. AHMU CJ021]|uniref:NUDIX domain-containing protein n=1 Tax=Actinoalloteichus TaxID=65496 RepID=UPI00068B0E7E|nr:NUDIX domain-containing protein [Actinoalloteichus caeruleus]AUS80890.1 hypothetical protein C1701_23965 [Actinoalloteichus sp. AHMU CJ021]
MSSERQRALVDVRVLALRDEDVLLIQLTGGSFTGHWNLPGGHVLPGENVVSAAVRELREEVGLRTSPTDLVFSSVTHHRPPTRSEKVTFTFLTRRFDGQAYAAEPDRAALVRWVPRADPPQPLMPQAEASLRLFLDQGRFDTTGLDGPV